VPSGKKIRNIPSEDINTIAVSRNPERRTAAPTGFVTGIKHPFPAKVIITDQMFCFSTDGAVMSHFPHIYEGSLYISFTIIPGGYSYPADFFLTNSGSVETLSFL
jgi:hypothetical protein